MPGIVLADVTTHLASYVPYSDDALIFTSPEETLFRHCNFRRRAWLPALATAELAGVHFHDLHHAGNTYTARPSSPEPETPPVASCYGIEHRSSDPQIGAGCSASRPESACAGQGQLNVEIVCSRTAGISTVRHTTLRRRKPGPRDKGSE
jgi:hypothetical protein